MPLWVNPGDIVVSSQIAYMILRNFYIWAKSPVNKSANVNRKYGWRSRTEQQKKYHGT